MYILSGELVIISRTSGLRKLRSISFHIFLIIFAGGVILESIIVLFASKDYKDGIIDSKIDEMLEYAQGYAARLDTENFLNVQKYSVINECNLIASAYRGRIKVYSTDGTIVHDTQGTDKGKEESYTFFEELLSGEKAFHDDYSEGVARVYVPVRSSEHDVVDGILLIEASLEIELIAIAESDEDMLLVLTIATVLLFLAAMWASSYISKPIRDVEASLEHVADGYLDDEVDIKGCYEAERISDVFNEMLVKMRNTEESRQEFVSNVSHELKTPMTSIKVLTDSLLGQPDAPAELYREFLTDISDEIERENRIITDLLTLVKLDKKSGEMNIEERNINELLEIILKRIRPIAAKRNIELIFESFRPVFAEVDEVKISLALSNLVENAVKYNVDDGWVRVSLNSDHKYFYITVADGGIGIDEDAQSRIFDRFYRVDKARSRQTGGTGLGLAITKNVIMMHNGSIKVYSKEEEGTTFTMRVPLAYIAPVHEPVSR